MQAQLRSHPCGPPDASEAWKRPAAASTGSLSSSSPLGPATPTASQDMAVSSPTLSPRASAGWLTSAAAQVSSPPVVPLPCGSLIHSQAPLGPQPLPAQCRPQPLGTALSTSSPCPPCTASVIPRQPQPCPAATRLSSPVGSCTLSYASCGAPFEGSCNLPDICGPLGAGVAAATAAASAAQPSQLGCEPSQVPYQLVCSAEYPAVPPNTTSSLPPPTPNAQPGPQMGAQPAAAAQGISAVPSSPVQSARSFVGSTSTEHGLRASPFALGSVALCHEPSQAGPSLFLGAQQARTPQQEPFACALDARGVNASYCTVSHPPRPLSKAQTFAKAYKKELGKELKRINPEKAGKAGKVAGSMMTNPCGCIFVGIAILGVALFFPIKVAVKTWRKVSGMQEDGYEAPLPSGQPPPQQLQLSSSFAHQARGGSGSGFSSYDGGPIMGGLPVVQEGGYLQLQGQQQ